MFFRSSFLIPLLLLVAAAVSQAQPAQKLLLQMDIANYRFDEEKNYVEVYYSFSRAALRFRKEEAGYTASVLMRSVIEMPKTKEESVYRTWRVPITSADTAGSWQNAMVGKVHFLLPPGEYILTVMAQDEENPSTADTSRSRLSVSTFGRLRPIFSDIEIASSIRQTDADTTNLFYKNTLEVIPNPSLVFGSTTPMLMYYVELYNCDLSSFLYKAEIINPYGKTILEKKKLKKAGPAPEEKQSTGRVEYGAIPVYQYPSNAYTFVISLLDTSGRAITSQSKKFYVYNPTVRQDSTMMIPAEAEIDPSLVSLSESEVDKEFAQASYIASREEKEQYKILRGSEAKRKFLTRFWRDRDSDPVTPQNEYRYRYLARINQANSQYRTAYREGWQSDRGRVFILYGTPDAIERHASEGDTRPYEIWTYDQVESGVLFVFVDRFGFNNYELVHSTKRNEIRDDDWMRFVQTAN